MFGLSIGHLLLVLAIVLVLFGPKRLKRWVRISARQSGLPLGRQGREAVPATKERIIEVRWRDRQSGPAQTGQECLISAFRAGTHLCDRAAGSWTRTYARSSAHVGLVVWPHAPDLHDDEGRHRTRNRHGRNPPPTAQRSRARRNQTSGARRSRAAGNAGNRPGDCIKRTSRGQCCAANIGNEKW